MSSSDVLWLKIWSVVATVGFLIVIIGVIIEGVEHFRKFSRKEHARQLRIEKLGWFLVVIGLAMEFLGDQAAKRISDRENARLNDQAGKAWQIAAEANERAANTESNNLVLQKEIQPRIITMEQVTNFINLSRNITRKIPITIHAANQGDDTLSYALQIRFMLDKANFLRDSSQNGVKMDNENLTTFVWREVGVKGEWPSVQFAEYGTNNITSVDTSIYSATNGFKTSAISETDPKKVYTELDSCFRSIGIRTGWTQTSVWLKPGEFEIYVVQKSD